MAASPRSFPAIMAALSIAACVTPGEADAPSLLASARKHASGHGEALWPGYGAAPFGLLLIDEQGERLFCQSAPPGFAPGGRDLATGCETASRGRSGLPANLLAAMPVLGPPTTIVVGTPAATNRSPADWTRTLLHEHFHQWQTALPDYYARVEALDLADGDETGMWMLNFAAPYDSPAVMAAHASASAALAEAVELRGTPEFRPALRRYLAARAEFAGAAGPRAWRYLEFQLWQEGVARWTEIELGRTHPDPAIRAAAEELAQATMTALLTPDLASEGRLFAYAYGAGEAMLLEECAPSWRSQYVHLLSLGPLFEACREPDADLDDRARPSATG